MIGSDLEGADLESRAAGWAASVISDDAAAVRTVIEAYGDRPTAANLVGAVSQCTGNAAVMQPGLETVVESQQFAATYDAFENMRLDFTFRFDDITVKGDLAAARATSQATITIRAVGETLPARLQQLFVLERTGVTGRSRSTCASRCRSSQEGAAPASSDFATRIRARSASARGRRARRGSGYADVYLPVQGPCRQTSRSRSRPCASWGAGAAAGHGSRPPMH